MYLVRSETWVVFYDPKSQVKNKISALNQLLVFTW